VSADIQHKETRPPATGFGFDSDGSRVATADFVYPGDGPEDKPTRGDTLAAICQFLRDLTEDAPALLAGQRLHLLAYLCGASDCQTQRQLAAKLNVTPGRISQILARLPSEWQGMARLKRRTAKRRADSE